MNANNHDDAEDTLTLSPASSFPPALIPWKRKKSPVIARASDDISCICGFSYDDGFSIACDDCSRWCHAACFDIMEGEVPEEFRCWECVPRPVDKERAMKLQKAKLGHVGELTELDRAKRRASPGIERKPRRASTAAAVATAPSPVVAAAAMDPPPRRKRRPSVYDELDVEEPWTLSYVHIPRDIIPHDDTRERLRRQAHHWRGVTALEDESSRTALRPLPSSSFSNSALSLCTNPSVRPPSYVVHTSTSIPSEHLITPYKSTITPSSSYLSDPLNSYAHLGMPKPFVHLFGHPLDLALDSRITGNSARFVRSGCRPNAVLRPFLCPGSDKPPETLSFGIFALRDLKANEEVILGWEWDDGHVVHNLPALIESPHAFPGASPDDIQSPEKRHHIRNQMSNILHALSSTFTTCACGARAKNCAITQMAAFVDGEVSQSAGNLKHLDLGPLVGARRGFRTREREPFSGGLRGVELCDEADDSKDEEDSRMNNMSVPHLVLSPASHDDQTTLREDPPPSMNNLSAPSTPNVSWRHSQATQDPETVLRHAVTKATRTSRSPMRYKPQSPGPSSEHNHVPCEDSDEDKMPPKMRKKWIQREANARYSECQAEVTACGCEKDAGPGIRAENEMDVDDPQSMPPPQILATPVLPGRSPSVSFSQLSLLSPIIPNGSNPPVSYSSLSPLLTSQNHTLCSPVHESDPSKACTEQPSALPHAKLAPAPEDDVNRELPSEPPPDNQALSLPEPPPAAQAAEFPSPSLVVSSPLLDDSPAIMPVPTWPLPTLQEEAREETFLPAIMETQSETVCTEQPDLPPSNTSPTSISPTAEAEVPHGTQKKKMSLKDFAIRKRKQREEEERARSAVTNELVPVQLLSPTPNGGAPASRDVSDSVQVAEEEEGVNKEVAELQTEEGQESTGIRCNAGQPDHRLPRGMATDFPPEPQPTLYTRQAKQELIDSPLHPVFDSSYPLHNNGLEVCLTSSLSSRKHSSHEDGEISTENDNPLLCQSPKRIAEPLPHLHPANFSRSHTPPTQPRSFNASPHTRSPSPSNSPLTPTTISRRPSLTPYRTSLPAYSPSPGPAGTPSSGTTTPSSSSGRPLPSGPRALRTVNLPQSNTYRPYSGSQYVPRGPSADRDRLDWERERPWQRTRVRGPGWGR